MTASPSRSPPKDARALPGLAPPPFTPAIPPHLTAGALRPGCGTDSTAFRDGCPADRLAEGRTDRPLSFLFFPPP